jgi:Family of unknown function (DUF6270)
MTTTFGIFGSCVTRDAFELGGPLAQRYQIGVYLARTTINSCLSAPVPFTNLFAAERRAKFEERCVVNDIFKLHFEQLGEKPFDYLLLDLIDERHAVVTVDGSYLCYSVPFLRMAEAFGLDAGKLERRLPRDKRVVEETLANIPRFLERLGAVADRRRIILHEALWATEFLDTNGTRQDFPNKAEIEQVNEVLRAYYGAVKAGGVRQSIAVPEELRVADANHRWTLEPFHYAEGYYRAFLTELERLTQPAEAVPA